MPHQLFSSKILLIGEYSILIGGDALSIPNPDYYGLWDCANKTDERLMNFAESISKSDFLNKIIDLNQFISEVSQGLFFRSNIPEGYGLGSSGALTAAVLRRYQKVIIQDKTILEVKNILAEIESFFHGKSSGLDPLVSYFQKPILKTGNEIIILNDEFKLSDLDYRIELIDSGKIRDTLALVSLFRHKIEDSVFKTGFMNNLMHTNTQAIQHLMNKETSEFIASWKKISIYSLDYFKEMIPEDIRVDWELGLSTEKYFYKLCGAGGGGFFLKLSNL